MSFSSKQITFIPKIKANSHNLSAIADYTNIAKIILGIIQYNYFGYGWIMAPTGASDANFETLWNMIYPDENNDYNNPGRPISQSDLSIALDNYQKVTGNAQTLLDESFVKDYKELQPSSDGTSYDFTQYLKPGSSFYENIYLNVNNFQTMLHHYLH